MSGLPRSQETSELPQLLQFIRDELYEGHDVSLTHDEATKLMAAFYEYRNAPGHYRAALEKIASGNGYYGEQAREYKEIAQGALA